MQADQPTIFDAEFRRRGEIGLQFVPHRLVYVSSGITRTVECCMVSQILDSTISPTVYTGDLLVSIISEQDGESPCMNNNVTYGMSQFTYVMQMMTNSVTYPNRTLRFLRPPPWCYKEDTNTTTLRRALDLNSARLIFDQAAIIAEATRPPPPTSSPGGHVVAPTISSIESPKVTVKALKVKSKQAWMKEQLSTIEAENMKTAEIIGDEVQKRIDLKNREVTAELLRVRQETEQTEFEAVQLAEEMKQLAETKKRRLAELTRKEIEIQAYEYARHQVAQEEMAERHAIMRERMQQEESERRIDKAKERQIQNEEDTTNRMMDDQSVAMNAALSKAQMELLAAGEDARRAQEELRAVEESVMLSVQRVRMQEERRLLELEQEAMKAETMKIAQAKQLAQEELRAVEESVMLSAQRVRMEKERRLLELEQEAMKAEEFHRLVEDRKQTEIESRALLEIKQTLADQLQQLNIEAQERIEAKALQSAQMELLTAGDGTRRAQEDLRAVEESLMLSMRLEEEKKQQLELEAAQKLHEEKERLAFMSAEREKSQAKAAAAALALAECSLIQQEIMKIMQAKQLAAEELRCLIEERKQTELESRALSEIRETLANELQQLDMPRQNQIDSRQSLGDFQDTEDSAQFSLEQAKLTLMDERRKLQAVEIATRLAKMAILEAEELKREQLTLLEIEQAKSTAATVALLEIEQAKIAAAALVQAEREKMEQQTVALAIENERLRQEALAVTTEKERLQKEADQLVAAQKEQALKEIESLKEAARRSESELLRMNEAMRLMESRQDELALETERKLMTQLLLTKESLLARQTEEDAKQVRDQEEALARITLEEKIKALETEHSQPKKLQNMSSQEEVEAEATASESDYESTRRLMILGGGNNKPSPIVTETISNGMVDLNNDLRQEQWVQRSDDAFVIIEQVLWGPDESSAKMDDEPSPSMTMTYRQPDISLNNNNSRRITREVAVVLNDEPMDTATASSSNGHNLMGSYAGSSNNSMNSQVDSHLQARSWTDASPNGRTEQSFDAPPINDGDDDYLMMLRTEEVRLREKTEALVAKLALCKSELAVLEQESVNTEATIGNYRDDGDVDIDVFSASERDRLTEYEHIKRQAGLAAYDRNKRIEEAVKYRVELRLASSELDEYDENNFSENDTAEDEYELDLRSEPSHLHVPEPSHFHVLESQDFHVVEPEPVDLFPNVADQVRAEARRLQLRAQEITLRRKSLLAEKERMNIIDVKCQAKLDEAARQIEDATANLQLTYHKV